MSTIKAANISNLSGTSTSMDNAINGSAKVWVNFNGSGTVAIRASYNVSSITDNATGDYTVNFTNALADANYASASIGYHLSGVSEGPVDVFYTTLPTSSAIRIQFRGNAGGDASLVNYVAFR